MKIATPQRATRTDIDMVPMINFAFLLLIFFMLTGSIANGDPLGVKPPVSAATTAVDPSANVLLLAPDGRIALGEDVIAEDQLAIRIQQWRAEHIGELLQVKADSSIAADRVVRVLETLRSAGIERVSLLTSRARKE